MIELMRAVWCIEGKATTGGKQGSICSYIFSAYDERDWPQWRPMTEAIVASREPGLRIPRSSGKWFRSRLMPTPRRRSSRRPESPVRRFVHEARLPIESDTVEKRPVGEPDIRCIHSIDGPVAFELVEICDSNFARFVATAKPDDGRYLRTSDPSASILAKKLLRQYASDAPLELLCYVDGSVITPDDVLLPTIRKIVEDTNTHYRRVWLLGQKGAYLVLEAGQPPRSV